MSAKQFSHSFFFLIFKKQKTVIPLENLQKVLNVYRNIAWYFFRDSLGILPDIPLRIITEVLGEMTLKISE